MTNRQALAWVASHDAEPRSAADQRLREEAIGDSCGIVMRGEDAAVLAGDPSQDLVEASLNEIHGTGLVLAYLDPAIDVWVYVPDGAAPPGVEPEAVYVVDGKVFS